MLTTPTRFAGLLAGGLWLAGCASAESAQPRERQGFEQPGAVATTFAPAAGAAEDGPSAVDSTPSADATGDTGEVATGAIPIAPSANPAPAQGVPEAPMPMLQSPAIPPGDGFFNGTQCFPRCTSAATDVDAAGQTDGYGFENGVSCIVVDSAPAQSSVPCIPALVDPAAQPEPTPPATSGNCPEQLVCPVVDGQTIRCGCGLIIGFGDRKQEIAATGGDQRFLASAMMETITMTADYPFGDVNPGPDGRTGTADDIPKTGGAANFGIAKQNWTMIRQCHPAYAGLNDGAYQRGAELNSNLALDIQVYDECRAFFGDRWFGGHRNGTAGLNNPNTVDVRRFQASTEWVRQMLDGHLDDDVQFYVFLQAI